MRFEQVIGDLRSLIHGELKDFKSATQLMMQRLEIPEERQQAALYLNQIKDPIAFDIKTHNGHITIQNPKTGDHRTFRIWAQKFKRFGQLEPEIPRVLSVMVAGVFEPIGWVTEEHGVVLRRAHLSSKEHTVYAALLNNIKHGESLGLLYHIEGRCRCCNLPLTNPISVRLGIGPICRGRLDKIDETGALVAA